MYDMYKYIMYACIQHCMSVRVHVPLTSSSKFHVQTSITH